MKIRPIKEFEFPPDLNSILAQDEYWEDESFAPITIMVEEIQYQGKDMLSYQAEFEVLDEYEDIDGDEWENLVKIYIKEKEPELIPFINGDSESSTCVIWTNRGTAFKKILCRMIELIENKNEIKRIKNKLEIR